MEKLKEALLQGKAVKERDMGEFKKMKVKGMNFSCASYEVEGEGTLSTMRASGMFGLVKMDTLIFTPIEKDAPLLSYDRMNFFGKDMYILELYDTQLAPVDLSPIAMVKEKFSALLDNPPKPHWYDNIRFAESTYKKGKKKQKSDMDALALEQITAYAEILNAAPTADREKKREKSDYYVNGLLTHGGPSTDVFLKEFGEDITRELFEKFLFGTR